MAHIAVDIAILPPPGIMDICAKINKDAFERGFAQNLFHSETRIPHISLYQGVIDEHDIAQIRPLLDTLCSEASPLTLAITEMREYQKPNGDPWSEFVVENTDGLQKLHEAIMQTMKPFTKKRVTTDMFYDPDNNVEEMNLIWVQGFIDRVFSENYDSFRPHITLKCAHPQFEGQLPLKFTATRVALCTLGDQCTCTKIIHESTLA